MKIGYKEYDEIAIVDPAGKLLVSISDTDEDKISVIEYQNYRALFGNKENPIKFIKKEDSNIYAEQEN